ncbi:MAG: hypothetical protein ACE5IY_16175 [bacterium]
MIHLQALSNPRWLRLVLVLLCGAACESPFSTRTPEPPDEAASSFIEPTTPDDVFLNMQIAFSERNGENYMRSFVDSTRSERRFEFVPDQGVAASQPGTFSNWDLTDERRYFVQMLQATQADSLIRLSFATKRRNETATTARFTQDYTIIVRHSRQTERSQGQATGQARFFLASDDDGDWAIYRWEDFRTDNEQLSWSDLKAFFQ